MRPDYMLFLSKRMEKDIPYKEKAEMVIITIR